MFPFTCTWIKTLQLHWKRQKSEYLEKLIFITRTFLFFFFFFFHLHHICIFCFPVLSGCARWRLNKIEFTIENEIPFWPSMLGRSLASKSSGHYLWDRRANFGYQCFWGDRVSISQIREEMVLADFSGLKLCTNIEFFWFCVSFFFF